MLRPRKFGEQQRHPELLMLWGNGKLAGPVTYLTYCWMNHEPLKHYYPRTKSNFRQMAVDTTGRHFSLSIEFQGRLCLLTVGTVSFMVWDLISLIPKCSRIIFQRRSTHQGSCYPHMETFPTDVQVAEVSPACSLNVLNIAFHRHKEQS